VVSLTIPLDLRTQSRFWISVAVAPAVLLVAHLLPPSGPGLALRLASAAVCVLLLPGALLLRAVAWPTSPAVAIAASFAFSLAVVGFALGLVFALGNSIVLAAGVLVVTAAIAGVSAALRGRIDPVPPGERRALAAVLWVSVPFAGVVWWAAGPIRGDGFFHLARARKLAEFDTLSTLTTVAEFKDGGLHPGYSFPLWHGVDALIARFAGVDTFDVVLYLPAILVPLAFVLTYAAGSVVFDSRAGGFTFVAAQVAYLGFSRRGNGFAGTGQFETLSQPQAASVLLLTATMLALAFAFAKQGGWALLVAVGAVGFALTVVHPTYAPYVALVVVGFLVARACLYRGWEPLLTRTALALAAFVVPFGLFLTLSVAALPRTREQTPSTSERASELPRYGARAFTTLGGWLGASPEAIAGSGSVVVAGLLAVPLAGFATRRLWAALVLGGSLAVLIVLLAPPVFTALADALSLAQARRLTQFLPIGFAVAGGCIVLSRLRTVGIALAGGTSVVLAYLYPGEFSLPLDVGGPPWAVWIAVAGGLAAIGAGMYRLPRGPDPSLWAVATAIAFVCPVAVAGLSGLTQEGSRSKLTPGIIEAVSARAAPGDVVFSDPATAYQIAAFAPVYINAAPPGNVASIPKNRERAREADARRFFAQRSITDQERRAILDRYEADWIVVDRELGHPDEFLRQLELVYQDGRFALYRSE
jgi:hypothetical protein